MRKQLLSLALGLFVVAGTASAQGTDKGRVGHADDLTLGAGQTSSTIVYIDDTELTYKGSQMYIHVPAGFSVAGASQYLQEGVDPSVMLVVLAEKEGISGRSDFTWDEDNGGRYWSNVNAQVSAHDYNAGPWLKLSITADEDVEPGDYTCFFGPGIDGSGNYRAYSVLGTGDTGTQYRFNQAEGEPVSFTIHVTDRFIMDENAPEPPATFSGKLVTLYRTFDADPDVWNTICLPFALPFAQAKTVFGSDIVAAALDVDNPVTFSEDGASAEIAFTEITSGTLTANRPYLIKGITKEGPYAFPGNKTVSSNIPGTDEAYDENWEKAVLFTGNYQAKEKLALISNASSIFFLAGNKFYRAIESTKIKGFRGYFSSTEELKGAVDGEVKINVTVNGEPTKVEGLSVAAPETGDVYTVDGKLVRRNGDVQGLAKGIYIQNGKKVYVK